MINLKTDQGKPRLSLVPPEMITQAARVMEYGEEKYGTGKTWKDRANTQQYIDALARHTTAFWADPEGVDSESGLPHLSHVAANVAMLCELMYGSSEDTKNEVWTLSENMSTSVPGRQLQRVNRNGETVGYIAYVNGHPDYPKYRLMYSPWSGPVGSLANALELLKEEYNEVHMK